MRISDRDDIFSADKKVDDGGVGGGLLAVRDAGGCHRHNQDENVNGEDNDPGDNLEFQC